MRPSSSPRWLTFMNRERARQWLDQRFFREEYDAAQDPAVARQPGPLRDRPGRSGDDGRQSDRRGAAPADDGHARERDRRGRLTPVTRLHGSAEPLPLEGGLVVDAALVGRAARDRARRSAIAGAPAAARGARVARVHGRGAAGAGRRRGSLADRRHRARASAVPRKPTPPRIASCWPASPRRWRSASTSCGCAGASAPAPTDDRTRHGVAAGVPSSR